MSKPIAIPFLLAAAVAIAFAIPAFLHPEPSRPDLPYFLASLAAACAIFGLSIHANVFTLPRQKMAIVQAPGANEVQLLPRQRRKWAVTTYPFYQWELHVEFLGDPPHRAIYPVNVERLLPAAPALF